jgi:hypothetical protein
MLAGLLGSGISRSAHSGFLGAIRSSFPIHINRTAHLSMPKGRFTSAHADANRPMTARSTTATSPSPWGYNKDSGPEVRRVSPGITVPVVACLSGIPLLELRWTGSLQVTASWLIRKGISACSDAETSPLRAVLPPQIHLSNRSGVGAGCSHQQDRESIC